jgi:hypothetical protein
VSQGTDARNPREIVMPTIVWIILGVVALFVIDGIAEKRRISRLLADNDRMWNELINTHQQAIAEAYQEGKGFQINVDRR